MPFVFGYFKEGKGEWHWVPHIGPAQKVMKQIEKENTFLSEIQNKTKRIIDKFDGWLAKQEIKNDKCLQYYIDKLNETCNVLLETNIHLQISFHINELLRNKLVSLFPELSETEIMTFAPSNKKADVVHHDDLLIDLIWWCKENKCSLTKLNFDTLIQKPAFKKKLESCYNHGYFLHSSYGGVNLWSLKREYQELREKVKEKIGQVHETKKEEYSFTKEQQFWVNVSQFFSLLRDKRKTIQQKVFYHMACLLEEIAKKSTISRTNLEHLRVDQITIGSLQNKKEIKNIINKQKEGYFFAWTTNKNIFTETGKDANVIYEKYYSEKEHTETEISGLSASQGFAKGIVRIVLNTHGKITFNKGDVLVTAMTSPDFVPLMRKASAIVTDLGGITCHAAIIAREFNKPCIVGTRIATKIFKEGDIVEVDAEKGIVKIIK
ncbi:hypothetical protein COV17_04155 [Candidatus Woesearchaeota archaeon CG10_big_fil_rev_8_21_14_0_10_36_11]|nr:MAG: hypothetical protein COV17_04155 [Candidatus Woesearchaeota archaeon CG10_big_fil_rev_8_21_14_0_10_36_11]